jgi:UDP:flavonoid glycosyltransferase YjiC (YdhE family)
MKFVLASYGGRGDVEPAVVVGRELLRRGHEVCMAVPPNLLAPQYLTRPRKTATRMTKPAESAVAAADRVENFARLRSRRGCTT